MKNIVLVVLGALVVLVSFSTFLLSFKIDKLWVEDQNKDSELKICTAQLESCTSQKDYCYLLFQKAK